MKVSTTELPGVLVLEPVVHADNRGYFFELHNQRDFARSTGIRASFVQDNYSRSIRGVLRGLHYQTVEPQGKLVYVVVGEIYDVVVDLRRASPTFGQWLATTLNDADRRALWIPPMFAHGFLAMSPHADVMYKTTTHRHAESEQCIAWNDKFLDITWPLAGEVELSPRDRAGIPFLAAPTFDE